MAGEKNTRQKTTAGQPVAAKDFVYLKYGRKRKRKGTYCSPDEYGLHQGGDKTKSRFLRAQKDWQDIASCRLCHSLSSRL